MANRKEQQELFEHERTVESSGPVKCLGMTFESEEARRAHFLEKLKERLPELRKRPDFPVAKDDDILRLSDPPYYTACPNPFLAEFVERHGRPYDPAVPYHREPFAVDVSEGKTDQLYKAHGYHTKVPHLAIVPSILHYTKPGDIVLDGFCGSGMTGVAAQWCGTAPLEYRREIEQRWVEDDRANPEWGARRVVLGDLSPAATFIAANYNLPFDVDAFAKAAKRLLKEVEKEIGWMYETLHTDGKTKGRINYTVWSEVFSCPECAGEVVFIEAARDPETRKVRKTFACPHCTSELKKSQLQRVFETAVDSYRGKAWRRAKLRPVLINYTVHNSRYEKDLDEEDLRLIDDIAKLALPSEVPTNEFPFDEMWEAPRLREKGLTHVHHLFFARTAHFLGRLWSKATGQTDSRLRNVLKFLCTSHLLNLSIQNRYRPDVSFPYNPMAGTYYVGSMLSEADPYTAFKNKIARIRKAFAEMPSMADAAIVTTSDGAELPLPSDSVDYIFTDPPFGDNFPYWELNYIAESWHRVRTIATFDAVVDRSKKNRSRQKDLQEYQRLMAACFADYCRVLKPGRWMTVVFHNSKNAVWNAIQETMLAAGFVVADVRTLDKKQGSFKQVTSIAVKQDLVISAYKPNHGLEERFKIEAGTEEGVWDFVRTHMRQLPVFVSKDGQAEVIVERQNFLLFDRMVAFHVQRGVTIPLSAAEFYAGLEQRFSERDGMYFLPEQVADYDRKRMTVKEVLQLELFVKDEESAIQWLKQQLTKKPQTFQEIHPQFMKELGGWEKHEKALELLDILQENFLRYDGVGEVPSQIHSYLSSNFKELRSLEKDDPALRAKAKDRWYVPDPRKAIDLERLRDRALLREFEEYLDGTQKKLKVFRLEAVRAGFKRAWQDRDYATIVTVARRIPEKVLQEDQKLLQWFDLAVTRSGEEV